MKNEKAVVMGIVFFSVLFFCGIFALTLTKPKAKILTEQQAKVIAEKTCIKGGQSLTSGYYNENSRTWWFDANLNATREGCNPACVVSEDTKTAEINWRCTGLIVPSGS